MIIIVKMGISRDIPMFFRYSMIKKQKTFEELFFNFPMKFHDIHIQYKYIYDFTTRLPGEQDNLCCKVTYDPDTAQIIAEEFLAHKLLAPSDGAIGIFDGSMGIQGIPINILLILFLFLLLFLVLWFLPVIYIYIYIHNFVHMLSYIYI